MNGDYARAVATLLLTALIGYGIYQFRDVPTDVASMKTSVENLLTAFNDERQQNRKRFDQIESRTTRELDGVKERLLDLERMRPAYDRP